MSGSDWSFPKGLPPRALVVCEVCGSPCKDTWWMERKPCPEYADLLKLPDLEETEGPLAGFPAFLAHAMSCLWHYRVSAHVDCLERLDAAGHYWTPAP